MEEVLLQIILAQIADLAEKDRVVREVRADLAAVEDLFDGIAANLGFLV